MNGLLVVLDRVHALFSGHGQGFSNPMYGHQQAHAQHQPQHQGASATGASTGYMDVPPQGTATSGCMDVAAVVSAAGAHVCWPSGWPSGRCVCAAHTHAHLQRERENERMRKRDRETRAHVARYMLRGKCCVVPQLLRRVTRWCSCCRSSVVSEAASVTVPLPPFGCCCQHCLLPPVRYASMKAFLKCLSAVSLLLSLFA